MPKHEKCKILLIENNSFKYICFKGSSNFQRSCSFDDLMILEVYNLSSKDILLNSENIDRFDLLGTTND